MFLQPWLSYCNNHRILNHQRRLQRRKRRRNGSRFASRHLAPEILEDRRLLTAVPAISVGDASPLPEGDTGTTGFEFGSSEQLVGESGFF